MNGKESSAFLDFLSSFLFLCGCGRPRMTKFYSIYLLNIYLHVLGEGFRPHSTIYGVGTFSWVCLLAYATHTSKHTFEFASIASTPLCLPRYGAKSAILRSFAHESTMREQASSSCVIHVSRNPTEKSRILGELTKRRSNERRTILARPNHPSRHQIDTFRR